MVEFQLVSDYVPKGDQPQAIVKLMEGIKKGKKFQTLLGATGTGKTYTLANVIAQFNRPTLVMAPNKLLAAQLYQEFKEFFPNNSVHYYTSYFDYYQPEAYLPASGQYIEKDSAINKEIESYRLASTYSLMTRSDVIVVASVSCIYGIGNPVEWSGKSFSLEIGMQISRMGLLKKLVDIQYQRNDFEFLHGKIRVRGDTLDVFPGYLDSFYRISFFGDEIEAIYEMHPITNEKIQKMPNLKIFPTREYITIEERIPLIVEEIAKDLKERVKYFKDKKRWAEAQRLEERTNYDLEMLRETGFTKGIENYSRYVDRREPGKPPACLYNYFPEEFLLICDESHLMIPQLHGMIGGDQARKKNLVDYGFRLPSALDNRPLRFEEWEEKISYTICMSATPGKYEIEKSGGVWVDQVIRPTGLIDPYIEILPVENQIDSLMAEIHKEIKKGNRVLATTLTKKMSENISDYFKDVGIKIEYLHSDIDTVQRMELVRQLRLGDFDVLIGINLLREGLDIPEVGLVAILDGDKAGFLRDTRSLIQTIGRASRNAKGRVIIFADKMTDSIKAAIKETDRRRSKQIEYNKKHNITPQTIKKNIQDSLAETNKEEKKNRKNQKSLSDIIQKAIQDHENEGEDSVVIELKEMMLKAAENLEFEIAAELRDLIHALKTGSKKLSKLKQDLEKTNKSKEQKSNTSKDSPNQEDDVHPQSFDDIQLLGTVKRPKRERGPKKKIKLRPKK